LIDELNEALKSTDLDDKTREDIDELTDMLRGNLEKVVQHGKRADSIVKNMLLHSREGSGEHRPPISTRSSRKASISPITARGREIRLQHHAAARSRSRCRHDRPYPQEITRVFLNLISNGFYAATKRKEAARRALSRR
jgi:signal transduction histidine kinase